MLRPSTESPSRDARPPRRPGVVVLPVAVLAAILALSVTAHGGGGPGDGDVRATPSGPAVTGSDTQDASDGDPADAEAPGVGQQPSAQGESPSPLPTRTARRTTPPRTGPGPTHTPASGSPTAPAAPSGTARPRPRPTAPRRAATSPAPTPYDGLRVGACFDIDRDALGTVVRRNCDTPHDAELVARLRLSGRFADDRAVRDAAAALCRGPLRLKAADQPLGTRWTTFVQYPYRTSYLLGTDTVACSLAVPSGTGRKLTTRLQ
ncbi:hypothetical protein ACGF1Z_02065 [Streptomyces sp. NPDC048018]|uniref:hypothetical protein n=1 Tax=Streptomyces sp. NPDC048018 TaxID=3365499 RepID=UPI00371FF73C